MKRIPMYEKVMTIVDMEYPNLEYANQIWKFWAEMWSKIINPPVWNRYKLEMISTTKSCSILKVKILFQYVYDNVIKTRN